MGVWGWREAGGGSAFRGRTHPPSTCVCVDVCAVPVASRTFSLCSLVFAGDPPVISLSMPKRGSVFCIRKSISASSFCTFICWHRLVTPGKDCRSFPFCPTSSGNSTNRRENNFSVQTPFGFCLNVKNNVCIFISIRCYFSK